MRAAFLLLFAISLNAQNASDLDFYRTLNDGRDADQMLSRYLMGLAQAKFAERDRKVRATTDWAAYRKAFREQVISSIGGLPERTPLNPRVTGTIQREGYRIEKVIFESQPKFYVTANLYVPTTGRAPYPAILFPLGHEGGAKAHDAWQRVLGNLAKRGFVLLAWDPVGQGERIQLYDEDFRTSKLVASTTEHTMAGIQSIVLGDAFARFTIWDGIRALDYLLSRPEVDTKRVGVTGNSGGGTHSSYLASLEDRIHVAAPSCYLTNWRKLLETIGPQDAEQCFPGFLGAGYDHPDFVLAFAPKPFMILSAIRDFFPILGARQTFGEAKRIYDSLGAADKIAMTEADDGHGYTLPRREAGYRWFTRWLQGTEDTTPEQEVVIGTEQELACTKTGQVLTSLGGESVYTLNVARMQALRKPGSIADLRRLTKFEVRDKPLQVQALGGTSRMQKLLYQTEPGIFVPAALFEPAGGGRKPAVLVVHGRGKSASMEVVRKHLDAGRVVMTIDVRGVGETGIAPGRRSGDWSRYFGDYNSAMTAVLLGKPLVAMRAEDISAGVGHLATLPSVDAAQISVHGLETAGVAALIATTLDSRVQSAVIEGGLVSYESVIRGKIHRNVFEQVIPGALRHFDLPDLVRWSSPRKVEIRGAVDPMGVPVAN